MVRTKKHFRPPSSSSSSSSSEEEDEPQHVVQRGRGKQLGNFGGGKQLSMAAPPGGRGKQLRAAPEPESEEESSEESSSEEEDEIQNAVPSPPPRGGGKQLRPMGRGKQLRAPSPQQKEEESDSDSSTSVYQPAAPVQQPVARRGMGKQLTRQPVPAQEEEEESDSSSDEEPWTVPPVQRGQGKQLRPPPAAAEKEESDMEESSSEEEEDEPPKKEEPPKPEPPKPVAKQPEPEVEESEESEFEPDPPKGGRGRPPARAAATRATRSAKEAAKKEISSEEEEGEEGEEQDSDSSDDSSDEEQEWDMETFDTQKLVEGKDDKKYLDSLPELERENILAERFEKLKSEADMKKALRENKRKERELKKAGQKNKTTKKRKAAKAKKAMPVKKKKPTKKQVESESEEEEEEEEEDDSEEEAPDTSADVALAQSLAGKRVSARNLVKKGKHFKKQAALAKIRENRANKQTTVEASDSDLDYGNDTDDSDDDYEESTMHKPWQQKEKKPSQLDEDSDEESMGLEDDKQMPMGSSQRRSEDIEAGLDEYIKVSIPRRRLIRWCSEPFFEKAVRNFYVRLGIGRDNKTQKPCYRLCRITGIVSKNEYSFPPQENRKAISTDKWLKVSFGKFVREFKMITVSDHRPSADDVVQLVSQLKTERQTDLILTKKSASKLRKRQDELVNNYTYSKEDIDMLVIEKKKRSKKSMNIASEKTRAGISVQAAQDEVEDAKKLLEDAKVERMEADDDVSVIAESNVTKAKEALENAKEKLQERIEVQQSIDKEDKARSNKLKKSSKIQNWVKVNQRAKMANQNADFQAYIEQQQQAKVQGNAEPKFDPYARRRQKPKNLWEVGGPNKAADAAGTVEEEKKESTPSERDDSNARKDGEKENGRDDIPDPNKLEQPANKFAFDDDIVIGDITNLGGIGAKKAKTRVRKGLSLEEYQEKKSAGTL